MIGSTPRLDRLDQNLWINGNNYLAQRKPSGTVSLGTSYAYGVIDRVVAKYSGTWNVAANWQRTDLDSSSSEDIRYAIRFGGTPTGNATLACGQRIESLLTSRLSGKKISISVQYYTSEFNRLTCNLMVPTAKDNHAAYNPSFYTSAKSSLNYGSVWQEVKWEGITCPSNITNGLFVEFVMSNAQTGTVSTTYIRRIIVSVGDVVLSEFCFNGTDQADEITKCERHCEKSYDLNTAPGTATNTGSQYFYGFDAGSYAKGIPVNYRVRKFGTTTTTLYSPQTGVAGNVVYDGSNDAGGSIDMAGTNGFHGKLTSASTTIGLRFHWLTESEL